MVNYKIIMKRNKKYRGDSSDEGGSGGRRRGEAKLRTFVEQKRRGSALQATEGRGNNREDRILGDGGGSPERRRHLVAQDARLGETHAHTEALKIENQKRRSI